MDYLDAHKADGACWSCGGGGNHAIQLPGAVGGSCVGCTGRAIQLDIPAQQDEMHEGNQRRALDTRTAQVVVLGRKIHRPIGIQVVLKRIMGVASGHPAGTVQSIM